MDTKSLKNTIQFRTPKGNTFKYSQDTKKYNFLNGCNYGTATRKGSHILQTKVKTPNYAHDKFDTTISPAPNHQRTQTQFETNYMNSPTNNYGFGISRETTGRAAFNELKIDPMNPGPGQYEPKIEEFKQKTPLYQTNRQRTFQKQNDYKQICDRSPGPAQQSIKYLSMSSSGTYFNSKFNNSGKVAKFDPPRGDKHKQDFVPGPGAYGLKGGINAECRHTRSGFKTAHTTIFDHEPRKNPFPGKKGPGPGEQNALLDNEFEEQNYKKILSQSLKFLNKSKSQNEL